MDQPQQAKKRKVSVVHSGGQGDQKRKWRKPNKGAAGGQGTCMEGDLCFLEPQLKPCISSEKPKSQPLLPVDSS